MKKSMEKSIEKKYLKEFTHYIPLRTKNRKQILSTVRMGVQDYINDYQIKDYNELVSGFGTPQENADSYLNESPSKIIASKRKSISFIVIVFSLLTLFITGSLAHYYYEQTPAYIKEYAPVEEESFPNDDY
jgi:hypothetical protein